MATNLLSFHSLGVRASAAGTTHRNADTGRRSTLSPPTSSSSNWWSPIFGWSSDPDYIDSNSRNPVDAQAGFTAKTAEIPAKPARSKFAPGCFTEEKAKRLRLMTTGADNFHDAMYHSAIASRLASDFPLRSDW